MRRGRLVIPTAPERPGLEPFEVACLVTGSAIVTVYAHGKGQAMDKAERLCERSDILELTEIRAVHAGPARAPDAPRQA